MAGLLIGGVVLGAGIGAMHYTGMLAMRMDALIRYDVTWFAASVVVAVVLATLAIRMMFFTVEAREYDKADHRLWTAAVMGLAVTLMHYTGMNATHFLRTGEPPRVITEGIALETLRPGSEVTVSYEESDGQKLINNLTIERE